MISWFASIETKAEENFLSSQTYMIKAKYELDQA
jgi:hypothetical protein